MITIIKSAVVLILLIPSFVQAIDVFDDWVTLPCTESLCCGTYLPILENPTLGEISLPDETAWDQPIEVSADQYDLMLNGLSRFHGRVHLTQDQHTLHADELILERNPLTQDWERLTAKGNLLFVAPTMRFGGTSAEYDHTTGHFHLDNATYRLYFRHARGKASTIDFYNKNAIIKLHHANYTTCSPLENTWVLQTQDLTLYPRKGRAVAKHVFLKLYGMPILYTPYIDYPIDNQRHSGFLFPSYGSSSNSGSEITIPYYWNMASNYDLTLAARWLSERGTEGQAKFGYLLNHGLGNFQIHYLPDDRKYAEFSEQNRLSPPAGISPNDPRIKALTESDDRLAINFRHTSDFSRRWQFNVLFDYVQDDNYFVDLGNDINTASTIFLPQQANLHYYGDHWTHTLNVEEYQVLQPLSKEINEEVYKRQPQWAFQAFYPNQFRYFTLGLDGEAVNFAHQPDIITQEAVTIGQRYHLRPAVSLPIQRSWYFFIPRAQLDWLQYDLQLGEEAMENNFPSDPSRTIPMYNIDSGLIFERDYKYKKYHLIQTLEPRVYYLYVPFRDQHTYPDFDTGIINFSYDQLFRDNRFSGYDRISDANQISLSLMSRFLTAQNGEEWLRASLGQIFYLNHDDVTLNNTVPRHSNLIGQAELHANRQWSGRVFFEFDSLDDGVEQASASIHYHPHANKIINFAYYWLREDIGQFDTETGTMGSLNQADISVLWPLTLHWHLISLWRYDLELQQTVEILGGLEYNACCLALQVVGSRYRQSNNSFYPDPYATGVFAQVVFKGLSAIGFNSPDNKLRQKISGYTPLETRLSHINQRMI